MLSRDSRIACIASRWRGRNAEKPQTRWSASASRRSASGVVVLDVVIDHTLEPGRQPAVGRSASGLVVLDVVIAQPRELGRKLVVGAAEGDRVPPVDEDRAARLLA